MSVHRPETSAAPRNPPSPDSATSDRLAAAIARAERAEEALAVAEEALQWVKENPHAHREVVFSALAKIAALKVGAE